MARPYDRQWQRVRLAVLARDQHRCQMQLKGCTIKATTVDHIVPLMDGGPRLDPSNLQAACKHCNSSDGAARGNRARRSPSAFAW